MHIWNLQTSVATRCSYLKLEPEYKIYLSFTRWSADERFAEQLDKDLEVLDQLVFCRTRLYCLPLGQRFAPVFLNACRKCKVGVVVLSEEYLVSKWEMNNLVEFVHAIRDENRSFILIPLYFKITVDDLSEQSIQNKWRPRWEEFVDRGIVQGEDLEEWAAAVRILRSIRDGLSFEAKWNSEMKYREAIVEAIQSALLRL